METVSPEIPPLTTAAQPSEYIKNHKGLRQVKASSWRSAYPTQSEICFPMIYPRACPQMYSKLATTMSDLRWSLKFQQRTRTHTCRHNNLLLQISIGMPLSIQLKYEQGKTVSWVSKLNRKGSVSRRFGWTSQKIWKTKPILAVRQAAKKIPQQNAFYPTENRIWGPKLWRPYQQKRLFNILK